eukprot:CAMPEP_0119550236 /NCGR_PEP_ID=MMETSP1352-20130426/3784_1 /TAXON_ID=265584 /ORGANISM="Stauroneis constricta, Strain CCMP1120" /LENGTH=308 /DNA_ID=CAMNT_0007596013 /DNA_START=83 /DNA_END=1005 /DNA_ORIENTATION=-
MCRITANEEDDRVSKGSPSQSSACESDQCQRSDAALPSQRDDDDERQHDDYPANPMEELSKKMATITNDNCNNNDDENSNDALPLHNLPSMEVIPMGCGILRNLTLVGIFPTARWLTDPTMPADIRELFGGTPFFPLGHYKVAWLDVIDGARRRHPLTFVVNCGVSGLSTGYWGGVFTQCERNVTNNDDDRNDEDDEHSNHNTITTTTKPVCWARFETTDEHETTVKEQNWASQFFVNHPHLEFDDHRFESGCVPGICGTQLERLIGLAVEYLLFDADWDSLPSQLVELQDRSARAERRRARQHLSST